MINIITMNSPYCRYLEFYSVVIVYSVSFKELAYCLLCYGRIMLIYRVFLFLAGYGSIVPEGGSVIGGKCQVYGGPQRQYKNIYPSTKIFIPVQKYLSQYKNIYPSTKIFIPVQKYLSQYKSNNPVQKYLSQYKNIYPSTEIFIPVRKYFFSAKIFILVQKYFFSTKIFFQVKIFFVININPARFLPCFTAPLEKFPPKQDGRLRY